MNAHTNAEYALTTGRRRIPDIIQEYDQKIADAQSVCEAYEAAGLAVQRASSVGGAYGGADIRLGSVIARDLHLSIKSSAWRYLYETYGISMLASASDKRRFEQIFVDPPEFTMENIRTHVGDLVKDPRHAMLRALAEVFSELDPFYKSHEKVRIGAKGMPKRVIIGGFDAASSRAKDKIHNILNALAAYQEKPMTPWTQVNAMVEGSGTELIADGFMPVSRFGGDPEPIVGRGVWLKRYGNGNGHLFFDQDTLVDVNKALAEFYGDVLPDSPQERPAKKRAGTDVSTDLQYYPTPASVVASIVRDLDVRGRKVLEPSCGCGRFMDALAKAGADVFGIEFDASRAHECRSKGHKVHVANFLDTTPRAEFDLVVMNPPFYGKHYEKHVRHALKYLKAGGQLVTILPATARYDHGLLDDLRPQWRDLPVGSFSDSGTNVNTVYAKITKPK